jgi:flagellar assembly protein FliH
MGTSKFLFETRFEAGATPPPPPRKSFNAAELDAARQEAERSGYAAGRAAALREIEARVQLALNVLVDGLGDALRIIHARQEAQGRETLAVATTIIRKLYPALSSRHELAELEALVAESLRQLASEPRIVVRVADDVVDAMKPRIDRASERAGYPGRVILLGDPALSDSQSRVEWADGGVERDPARVWADIDAVLQRHIAGAAEPDMQTRSTENQNGK